MTALRALALIFGIDLGLRDGPKPALARQPISIIWTDHVFMAFGVTDLIDTDGCDLAKPLL